MHRIKRIGYDQNRSQAFYGEMCADDITGSNHGQRMAWTLQPFCLPFSINLFRLLMRMPGWKTYLNFSSWLGGIADNCDTIISELSKPKIICEMFAKQCT